MLFLWLYLNQIEDVNAHGKHANHIGIGLWLDHPIHILLWSRAHSSTSNKGVNASVFLYPHLLLFSSLPTFVLKLFLRLHYTAFSSMGIRNTMTTVSKVISSSSVFNLRTEETEAMIKLPGIKARKL